MPTPGEFEPGTHVVSFRLDHYGDDPPSIIIENVATGWGGFVNIADLNVDGVVNVSDLLILMGQIGSMRRLR